MNNSNIQLCVIGDPVAHSVSPGIHSCLYTLTGTKGVTYTKKRVAPQSLEAFLDTIRAGKLLGCNVTLPHKERIMPLLDRLDESACAAGAVNTVITEESGLAGYNTDTFGCTRALMRAGFKPGGTAVIFGSGGAARAGILALARMGQKHISIISRNRTAARNAAAFFSEHYPDTDIETRHQEQAPEMAERARLIINATPVGMWPRTNECVIADPQVIRPGTFVFDMVPRPLHTQLLKYARHQNAVTVPGLRMLIAQAVRSHELWFNEPVEQQVYDRLWEHLAQTQKDTDL